jgi:hypothetical protein
MGSKKPQPGYDTSSSRTNFGALDICDDNLIHLAADGTIPKPSSGPSCARSNTNAATSPSA